MDYIRKYDIELEKEHYYAGEVLRGWVVIENAENLRMTGVQVYLRGKSHVEWRITRGGERRTVKEDQYFIDEKALVWGKESGSADDNSISILPKDDHRFPFEFQLPDTRLPCSFESRVGTVRYYLRVIIDIPYASPPQGLKYFTVVGPHIDCFDGQYTTPQSQCRQTMNKCLCCTSGPISLDACLERNAYCCGEFIRLKCDAQNGSDQNLTLYCRLIQNVEYRINKGSAGLSKDVSHQVLEVHSPTTIPPHSSRMFHDLPRDLQIPVMPPTMNDVCKVIEIYYVLKVGLHMEKSGEDLQVEFPLVIATVPPRAVNSEQADLCYEPADDHVEGGIYISPEFQLGQVYDGAADVVEDVILYRPVYVCVPRQNSTEEVISNGHSPSSQTAGRLGSHERLDGHTPSPVQAARGDSPERQNGGHSPSPKLAKSGGDAGGRASPRVQECTSQGKSASGAVGGCRKSTESPTTKKRTESPKTKADESKKKTKFRKSDQADEDDDVRPKGGGGRHEGRHSGGVGGHFTAKFSAPARDGESSPRPKTSLIMSHKESIRHVSHATRFTSTPETRSSPVPSSSAVGSDSDTQPASEPKVSTIRAEINAPKSSTIQTTSGETTTASVHQTNVEKSRETVVTTKTTTTATEKKVDVKSTVKSETSKNSLTALETKHKTPAGTNSETNKTVETAQIVAAENHQKEEQPTGQHGTVLPSRGNVRKSESMEHVANEPIYLPDSIEEGRPDSVSAAKPSDVSHVLETTVATGGTTTKINTAPTTDVSQFNLKESLPAESAVSNRSTTAGEHSADVIRPVVKTTIASVSDNSRVSIAASTAAPTANDVAQTSSATASSFDVILVEKTGAVIVTDVKVKSSAFSSGVDIASETAPSVSDNVAQVTNSSAKNPASAAPPNADIVTSSVNSVALSDLAAAGSKKSAAVSTASAGVAASVAAGSVATVNNSTSSTTSEVTPMTASCNITKNVVSAKDGNATKADEKNTTSTSVVMTTAVANQTKSSNGAGESLNADAGL